MPSDLTLDVSTLDDAGLTSWAAQVEAELEALKARRGTADADPVRLDAVMVALRSARRFWRGVGEFVGSRTLVAVQEG